MAMKPYSWLDVPTRLVHEVADALVEEDPRGTYGGAGEDRVAFRFRDRLPDTPDLEDDASPETLAYRAFWAAVDKAANAIRTEANHDAE